MAVKPPRPEPRLPKDVDDAHAEKFHGRKKSDVARPKVEKEDLSTPDQRAFADAKFDRDHYVERRKGKSTEEDAEEEKKRKRERESEKDQDEDQKPAEAPVKAGRLALDDNHKRRHTAQPTGIDGAPALDDVFGDMDDEPAGESLDEMLSKGRVRHPDLGEAEIEPPPFLKPLEAMQDIYMKTRGRMSRRTKELLEGIDLEDLIDMMHALFDDERMVKRSDARHPRALVEQLGDDSGPILTGFNDPRLTELWRLFLEGWEIWVPEGVETGVDLFWEGEAEDEDGNVMEILQSLQYRDGEAILHAKIGELEDKITFDGEAFYRLKHEV